MTAIAGTRYHSGQRIRVRDRIWEIDAAPSEVETTQVLILRDVQERSRTIEIIAEIESIEVLPPSALPKAVASFARWRDLHAAIACTMKPAPDVLGGFDQAKMRTEDYQLVPVIRAFDRPLQRILIADDVGLGKTVEAILILLELHARARADRVLIVCPAGLQDQWKDELLDKAGLEFEIYDSTRVLEVRQQSRVGQNPWTARRRVITSVDYVKRADVKRALRDVPWDLVIADEAHYLSETSSEGRAYRTERSRFAKFIADRTDSLILLTATPHNGDPRSLYSLVELLDPALVASPETLSGAVVAPVVVRRCKSDIFDEEGRPRFKGIDVRSIPVPFGDERERRLYDAVVKYCRKLWKRDAGTAVGFAMTVIKKRLMSSRFALERTLAVRLDTLADEPLNIETKRGLLRDYREGAPLTEEQMESAERQVIAAPAGDAEERAKERREIDRLLKTSQAIPSDVDSKFTKLFSELLGLHSGTVTGKPEKAIVFTEFRDTHTYLIDALAKSGYAYNIAILTGAMGRDERREQIERFGSSDTMLLLATDAASEGLNLQEHCRVIIHYELPWNPNRLEQRNGRVYRWGQREDVLVRNLIYEETYDAHIIETLTRKVEQIRRELGSSADVIGVMSKVAWEDLLMEGRGVLREDALDPVKIDADIDRRVADEIERAKAWREDLGPRAAFSDKMRIEVEARRARGADRRLDPSQRKRITEWIVPAFGGSVRQNGPLQSVNVPQALRRDLEPEIPAAAYSFDQVPEGRKDVAVLGMFHPLLIACGNAARATLYDSSSPLAFARLAAKRATIDVPGVIITFAVVYALGEGTTLCEEVVPIFMTSNASVSGDALADEALAAAAPAPGILTAEDASILEMRKLLPAEGPPPVAEAEAFRRAAIRTVELEAAASARYSVAIADVDRWAGARRQWLEGQLSRPPAQMTLELDEALSSTAQDDREVYERQRRRLKQQLDTLDAVARERKERLESRANVVAPRSIEFIGALVVLPVAP